VPVGSVKELIALAQAKPGQLNYASSGIATSTHMAAELFMYLTRTNMVNVPYKGGAPAMTAMLGGQCQLNFATISTAIPHVRAGKLRALAHWGEGRLAALPDVPSLTELGYPVQFAQWSGLFVPAGTPEPVIAKLREAARFAAHDPKVQATIGNAGSPVLYLDAPEFARYWQSDAAKMAEAVAKIGKVE
jgi:tripartite-type tricarboxylate transporter receptor subunit TctC